MAQVLGEIYKEWNWAPWLFGFPRLRLWVDPLQVKRFFGMSFSQGVMLLLS